MSRSQTLSTLANETFDLVIIGGGIHGTTAAFDASLRGLKVALIEKRDFSSETTAGTLKVVHGGLRYLQNIDLIRLYESAKEQRVFRQIAPHFVSPLPFLVPCYGYTKKSLEYLTLGLNVYELLAFYRNNGITNHSRLLPRHKVISKTACLDYANGLNDKGLRGGIVFYDCQISNSDRFTLSFALTARNYGATVLNYVEATGAVWQDTAKGTVIEALKVKDVLTLQEFEIRTRAVLNVTGPWTRPLHAKLSRSPVDKDKLLFSKGVQAIVPSIGTKGAIAVESSHSDKTTLVSRGNRSYFLLPWREHTLVGTADILVHDNPNAKLEMEKEAEELVAEAALAYHSSNLSINNIKYVFGGLRPVDPYIYKDFKAGRIKELNGTVPSARRDEILDGAKFGKNKIINLLSITGIKLTTARVVAEHAITLLAKRIGKYSPSKSAATRLADAPENYDQYLKESITNNASTHSESEIIRLVSEYGIKANEIIKIQNDAPATREKLFGNVSIAEIIYCSKNELVEKTEDVIFRRTGMGTLGKPPQEVVERVEKYINRA